MRFPLKPLLAVAAFLLLSAAPPISAATPAATLNSSFAQAGLLSIGGYSDMNMALQSDDKILLVGTRGKEDSARLELLRYEADGKADDSFGKSGVVETGLLPVRNVNVHQPLAPARNGKILLGHSQGVARFNADGTLDSTWGEKGLATCAGVLRVATQSDGAVVVLFVHAGESSNPLTLTRFTPQGLRDSSFTDIVFQEKAALSAPRAKVAVSPFDDAIVVFGEKSMLPSEKGVIWRFNRAGKVDLNFAASGHFEWQGAGQISRIGGLSFERGGLVVAALGSALGKAPVTMNEEFRASHDLMLFRLDRRGQVVPGYGTATGSPLDFGGIDEPTSLALGPDGTGVVVVQHIPDGRDSMATSRFIDGGMGRQQNLLIRLDAQGHPDLKFAAGDSPVAVPSPLISDGKVAIQKSGRILCLTADGTMEGAFELNIKGHQVRCYNGFAPPTVKTLLPSRPSNLRKRGTK